MNAVKTFLAFCINGVSVVIFVVERKVEWRVVPVMVASSIVGGYLGARVARRISAAPGPLVHHRRGAGAGRLSVLQAQLEVPVYRLRETIKPARGNLYDLANQLCKVSPTTKCLKWIGVVLILALAVAGILYRPVDPSG